MPPFLLPSALYIQRRAHALLVALAAAAPLATTFAASIEWNNTGIDFATGSSWVGGAAPANDATTDIATFGNNGGPSTSPALTANRSVNGLSFLAGAFSYTLGGTGTLRVGSNGVVNNSTVLQTFAGPLSLNNSQTWTTVVGGNLVVNGTLDLNPSGTSSRSLTVAGAGNTTLSGTLFNTAALAGNLTVSSTGITLVTGANTYTGNTTVNAGATLKLGHAQALGSTAAGTIVNSGGTLDLNGQQVGAEGVTANGTGVSSAGAITNTSASAASLAGNLVLSGSTTINASAGAITLSGNIDLNNSTTSARTLTVAGSADVTLSGNLSHSFAGSTGNLTLTTTGTVLLSGNNTFTGNLTVNSGATLKLGSATAAGADANYLSVQGGGMVDLNGYGASKSLRLSGSGINTSGAVINTSNTTAVVSTPVLLAGTSTVGAGNITFNAAVDDAGAVKGLSKRGSGTLTLAGLNTYTGATSVRDGTLLVNGSLDAASTVSVTNNGTLGGSGLVKAATTVDDGFLGSAGATLSLGSTLTTTGTALLNTHSTIAVTGGTTVFSGTFTVNGTLNSPVTVATGGTLSGSGLITGATTLKSGATLAPGNSPGRLSFGNDLTLLAGSLTLLQVGGNTTAGTDYDQIAVTGQLTFGGGLNVVAVDLGGGAYPFAQPGTFALFTAGTGAGNFDTVTIGGSNLAYDAGLASWSALNLEGFDYTFSPGTGLLTIAAASAIPEPSTYAALLGAATLAGALVYRRQRRS